MSNFAIVGLLLSLFGCLQVADSTSPDKIPELYEKYHPSGPGLVPVPCVQENYECGTGRTCCPNLICTLQLGFSFICKPSWIEIEHLGNNLGSQVDGISIEYPYGGQYRLQSDNRDEIEDNELQNPSNDMDFENLTDEDY